MLGQEDHTVQVTVLAKSIDGDERCNTYTVATEGSILDSAATRSYETT